MPVPAKPVNSKRKIYTLVVIVLVAMGVGLMSPKGLPFVRIAEHWLYDVRIAYLTPARAPHPDIVLVTVTEDTFSNLPFRSPLDRRFFGNVVSHLVVSGVRAIGVDSIFDQATVHEDDVYLHNVFRRAAIPVIVGEAASQTYLTEKQRAFQKAFLSNLNSAYVNVITDKDGTVRRAFRGQQGPKGWVPGLADSVADALGVSPPGGTKNVHPIAYYPALEGDQVYKAFRSFPAHTVPFLPKAWFKDKIVLFGAELTLDDRLQTPFSRTVGTMPGLYVHAYALAQILDNRQVKVPPVYLQIILVALVAICGVVLAVAHWPIYLRWGAIALLTIAGWGAGIAFYRLGGVMMPLVSPTLSLFFASGMATIYLGYQERQQQRFLRDAFSRYVSPNLVDDIVSNPDQLDLEGERRDLTYVFTDLAGFTSLAEQLDPAELVNLLNGYIDGMCAIVFRHGGTVDKIVGDAIVAYWGAPIESSNHRARAVACALDMDEFAENYRQQHVTRAGELGITRIGINSGSAIVGNFGGANFFDYTAHGDMVNTAARLEGANKYLGTRICVGRETREGCPDLPFRSVADLILKGKTEAIRVFEPVPNMAPAQIAEFEDAFQSLSDDDPGALKKYQNLLQSAANDPVATLHCNRLRAGQTGSGMTLTGK